MRENPTDNADIYFRKARTCAALAAAADDPSMVKTYSKLASDYVRLARNAIERHVEAILAAPHGSNELIR